jgi:hypothetical protein
LSAQTRIGGASARLLGGSWSSTPGFAAFRQDLASAGATSHFAVVDMPLPRTPSEEPEERTQLVAINAPYGLLQQAASIRA